MKRTELKAVCPKLYYKWNPFPLRTRDVGSYRNLLTLCHKKFSYMVWTDSPKKRFNDLIGIAFVRWYREINQIIMNIQQEYLLWKILALCWCSLRMNSKKMYGRRIANLLYICFLTALLRDDTLRTATARWTLSYQRVPLPVIQRLYPGDYLRVSTEQKRS